MKIPFEPTITGAYRFAFANILSIIGIGWFPYLLFVVIAGATAINVVPLFHGLIIEGTTNQIDTARLGVVIGPLIGAFALVSITGAFAQAMVYVGLMRKALGQHPAPVYIFFSLGSQVWQMIGSYLLLGLLAWGLIALAGAAVTVISLLLQKYAPNFQVLVTVLLAIACYVGAIYAIIRVMFFIPAVVVAENHIGIRRAWHLGKGNFWRIVGVILLVVMPLGFAMSTITQGIMQTVVGAPATLQPGASPAEVQAFIDKMLTGFIKIAPYFAGLEVIYLILLSGLLAGASAAAYKSVTGGGDATAKEFA
jgi:hypothetical protein